jgi:tetratricopeptide (TPR) repeat protein
VRDRNTRAFVVPSARAAWKSFQDGNFKQAFEHYKAACSEDPDNGYLYDRFAYSLFSQRRYEAALEKAKRATALLKDEPEPWFTQGMIEARLGRPSDAVKDLDRADSLGKPKHLCELQRAYAHVYSDPKDLARARQCVEHAIKLAPRDRFLDKFASEVTAFKNRWLRD